MAILLSYVLSIVIPSQQLNRQDWLSISSILRSISELLERLALNLVVALRVHQILCAQDHHELPHVHFRYENLVVAHQHVAQIPRQRVQVAQVNVPDAIVPWRAALSAPR